MCLILFAWQQHPEFPLIVAANRDEFFHRPSESIKPWAERTNIIAGRDLESGGTWLGISLAGRFAAVTNYREPGFSLENPISRGLLVSNFLESDVSADDYLSALEPDFSAYRGFNILLFDGTTLVHHSNRQVHRQQLLPGFYGLSNHLLDTDWPKVTRGKLLFEMEVNKSKVDTDSLLAILADEAVPNDSQLPDTGIDLVMEKSLASIYINREDYGTRASSIVLLDNKDQFQMIEKSREAFGGANIIKRYPSM